MYTVEIIESDAQLALLADEWPSFTMRCDHCDFRQDPVKIQFQQDFDKRDRELRLIVLRRDGQIHCVAPFRLQSGTFRLEMGLLQLMRVPIQHYRLTGTALAFSRDADRSACLDALGQALRERRFEYDIATIECLPLDDVLFSRGLNGFKVLSANPSPEVVWELELAKNFDDYLGRFKKKSRYNLKRNLRLLQEFCDGEVESWRADQPDQIGEFLDALDHIYGRSWQGKTFGYRQRNGDAWHAYLRAIAERGWLRGYLLRCRGEPVAYVLGYQYAGRYYYEEIGYDQGWRRHNPGNVLTLMMLEDLHRDNRPEILDFGYGDNDYKKIFGSRKYLVANAHIVPSFGKGRLLVSTRRLFGRIHSSLRKLVLQTGLESKVRSLLRRS